MFDFSAERVTKSIDESLQRLGVEYLDLVQVQDMEFAPSLDIIVNETLPALQKVEGFLLFYISEPWKLRTGLEKYLVIKEGSNSF